MFRVSPFPICFSNICSYGSGRFSNLICQGVLLDLGKFLRNMKYTHCQNITLLIRQKTLKTQKSILKGNSNVTLKKTFTKRVFSQITVHCQLLLPTSLIAYSASSASFSCRHRPASSSSFYSFAETASATG